MFWCIETIEQLKKFSKYEFNDVFVQPIQSNDNFHPKLSEVIALYIRPFKSKSGFLIPFNHSEGLNKLKIKDIKELLIPKLNSLYTSNYKKFLHYNIFEYKNIICYKTCSFFNSNTIINERDYDTVAHKFYYDKYEKCEYINRIIPLSKHLEKWDNYFNSIKINKDILKEKYYKFYNNILNKVLYDIEKQGINMDLSIYKNDNAIFSYYDMKHYPFYNQYTTTSRPSNSFNNINLGALNKNDSSRLMLTPENDIFLEYDYKSYHPRLLSELIGYKIEDDDIHTNIGKIIYSKDILNEEEYTNSKKLNFKYMYSENIPEYLQEIEFFKKISIYRNKLWDEYTNKGYISSEITGRPIKYIDQKNKLLPYLLQVYETERNMLIMKEIITFLQNKNSKLVHYCYDSFLIDFCKKDGKSLIYELKDIFEQDNFRVSVKYGYNYKDMYNLDE